MEEIEKIALQVRQRMDSVRGLFNIQSSFENGAPEVELVIDRVKAGMYNLNVSTVVSQLQDQLQGKNAGQLSMEEKCATSPSNSLKPDSQRSKT